jgi:hypothetical protein
MRRSGTDGFCGAPLPRGLLASITNVLSFEGFHSPAASNHERIQHPWLSECIGPVMMSH